MLLLYLLLNYMKIRSVVKIKSLYYEERLHADLNVHILNNDSVLKLSA